MSLAIIGPSALQILEKDNSRVILFSDIHGGVEKPAKIHEKIFNLDDFILNLMHNNSKNNKKTDLYIESPCYTAKSNKGNEYVGERVSRSKGWLKYVLETTENATRGGIDFNYKVHRIDARQNDDLGFFDVLTWSGELIKELLMSQNTMTVGNNNIIGTPVCVILELLDIITVLIDNSEAMWNMCCDPFGFRDVLKVIKALEDLNKNRFSIAARSVISLMTRNATTRRDINIKGETKRVQMHKIALQYYKLQNINKETADRNYSYLNQKYKNSTRLIPGIIEGIKISLKKYDILFPISKVDCWDKMANLVLHIMLSGACFMDMYAISRLLYNISDDIIVYAGAAHIDAYYDLLLEDGYKNILEATQLNGDRMVYIKDIFFDHC
jgi:hypothetical protein